MLKAIQAELYKLFKNRTFKVLICVAVLLSTLTVVMCSSVFEKILNDSLGNMPQDQKEVLMEQLTSMSESEAIVTPGQLGIQLQAKDMMNPTSIEVYHASFGSGVIEIIIGILVGALIAKEYSQGTIKNFLAYGKRREEFYLAKFVSMVIAVTIILAVMTILPTIVVTLMNGWGQAFEISQLLGMIKTFVASVIASSAVAALAMIIATLVKSNGATIGITVAIFIGIPTLAGFLYGIYPWFDRVYEVLPFYNSALATSIKAGNGDLLRSVIISLVTIAISLFVGIKIFKSQDIK
ncbi:ABC transporter permease subunit [Clostridium sp.]|uniref:ABC transporter permease subunit n=1 Tax=Clostridium sp. TaxID=1506 RepID=UPI0035211077